MNTGKVTLVGAGPGDPELLTLKALKAIQAATLLLVDDLVSSEIVAHAPKGARIVYVGKRGGCKSTPQAFIEKLMLMAVRKLLRRFRNAFLVANRVSVMPPPG